MYNTNAAEYGGTTQDFQAANITGRQALSTAAGYGNNIAPGTASGSNGGEATARPMTSMNAAGFTAAPYTAGGKARRSANFDPLKMGNAVGAGGGAGGGAGNGNLLITGMEDLSPEEQVKMGFQNSNFCFK